MTGWKSAGLIASVVVASGCGGDDMIDESSPAQAVPDPVATDSMALLGLVEELRIGSVTGAPEYSFGSITHVAPSQDGSVYVADLHGPTIRKFGADGAYLAHVGRVGGGPGEFESVDGLGVDGEGRLLVYDGRNARLSWFTATGEFLRSVPIRNGAGFSARSLIYGRDTDPFVAVYSRGRPPEPDGDIPRSWAVVRDNAEPEAWVEIPDDDSEGPSYVLAGRGGYYRPFTRMTLSALGRDGSFYTARNDDFRIAHRRPNGSTTYIVEDEAPILVTGAELKQWQLISEAASSRSRPVAPGRSKRDRSAYFPIPTTKPFFRDLVVDLDGRLWVSRYTEPVFVEYTEAERDDRRAKGLPSFEWRDRPQWDIYSPEDRYLGFVVLPHRTGLVTAEGNRMWGVQSGEFDEDYVVRWSFEPSGGSM